METTVQAPELGDTPAATVEPTAAPEAPSAGFHELNKSDRAAFLRDGKLPKKDPVSDDAADSSPAPAEGQKAAETAAKDVKAASEPAAPAKDKKARNSEENRVQELLTERQRERERADRAERRQFELEQRLNALERGSKADGKTDSSTKSQPDEPKWKQIAAAKEFPKIEDFDSPNEWAAAVHLHTQQTIESTLSQREQQSTEMQQVRAVAEKSFTHGLSEIEADPTLMDRIDPGLENLPGARAVKAAGHEPNVNHYIKDTILFETERPVGLMAFYSTPEGKQEWAAMRGMTETARLRTILAREIRLGTTAPQGDATKAEKKAVVKTFTKAPAPTEKEGPKGAVASDGADSAVKTGDYAALERELDARGDGLSRRWGRRRA